MYAKVNLTDLDTWLLQLAGAGAPAGAVASAMRRVLLRASGGAVVAGGAAAAYAYQKAKSTMGEESVSRLLDFYEVALPATVEYKWVEARCETLPKQLPMLFPPVSENDELEQFKVLHEKWARPVYDKCMKLGGFYCVSPVSVPKPLGGVGLLTQRSVHRISRRQEWAEDRWQ